MTAAVPQQQLMGASKASFQPNMAPRFGFDPITMTAGALALKGLAIGALAFAWHAITTAALVIGGCCVGATGLIAAAATAPKWWPALTKMFKA